MSRDWIFAASATALLAALPLAAHAADGPRTPFSATVAFGDSLSDDGNIALSSGSPTIMRFTTNPGVTTIENVATYVDHPLAPSLLGGADYAYGGAGVTNNAPGTPAGVPTETTQITGYLSAHPQLDPHTLYSVFAGANDIFAAATSLFLGQASAAQATATISAAGTQEGALIAKMQAAGAKNIIVFNLPDIGLTPQALGLNAFIPTAGASLTGLSQTYNAALNAAISASPKGIIPVNTFLLLRETVANAAQLGFVNVTTAACTTASSFNCTPSTLKTPDAAQTYLFADAVHPTTAAHAIFAQAVESELVAPSYVSLLAEAPLATAAAQRSVWSQELALDGATPATGSRAFARVDYDSQSFKAAGFSGSADNDGGTATVGVDFRPAPNVSFGAAFSGALSNADFDDGGAKFRTRTLLVSVFGQYLVGRGGYVDGAAGLGVAHFGDIARSFALGPSRRLERGSTDGTTATATVGGGWWFGGEGLKLGPYVEAQYERVRVDGYAEEGTDATAMTFGDQTREALVGEAGLKLRATLHTGFGDIMPYGSVAYDYDARAETRYVDAGLVTLPGEFSDPGYAPARSWGSLQAGVEMRFATRWTAFVGYQGRFADSSQDLNAANVGVKLDF